MSDHSLTPADDKRHLLTFLDNVSDPDTSVASTIRLGQNNVDINDKFFADIPSSDENSSL